MVTKLQKQIAKTDEFFERYGKDLTQMESNVLRLYYGLDNGKTKTIRQIAKAFMSKVPEIERNLESSMKKMGFSIYGYYLLISRIFDGDVPPIYEFNLVELKEILDKTLEFFQGRELIILKGRLGILSQKKYTLEYLGNMFDVSKERIRQLEERILKKLQKPKIKEPLKEYLKQVKSNT